MKQEFQTLKSSWRRVGQYTIHARYREGDSAERPPLVLVHGVGVSGRNFLPTAEALAARYRVYVPDLPGFGLSSTPRRILNVPALAEALRGWLDATGLEQSVLVGSSFGCQVAIELACRFPDRVSGLVLVGPTVDAHARNLPQQAWRWRLNKSNELPSLDYPSKLDYRDCGVYRFVATFLKALQDRPEEKLANISQPILVVRGQQDRIVSHQWAEEVTHLLPDGQLSEVEEAAHTVNYSHPQTLTRLIDSFVSTRLPTTIRPVRQEEEIRPVEADSRHRQNEQRQKTESKGKAYQPPLPAAKYVAAFDSASSMLRTLGSALHGRPVALVGGGPLLEPVAMGLNKLPTRWREGFVQL